MSATADDVAGRLERFADAVASDAYNADPWKAEDAASDAPLLRAAASLIRSQAARIEKLEGALQSIRRLVGDDDNEQHEWTAQDMVEALQDADQTARAALERT